jgi:fatty-acyl-CoA synthase
MADAFDLWADRYGSREAVFFRGQRLTFAELKSHVDEMARALMALGVRKNDKVAIWMPNSIEWIYTFFAIAKTGAVAVPMSTRYRTLELDNVVRHADVSTLIFVDSYLNFNCIEMLYELCPGLKDKQNPVELTLEGYSLLRRLICLSPKKYNGCLDFREVKKFYGQKAAQEELAERQKEIFPDDVLSIIHTSGTTGVPKGAMLANHAVVRKGFDRAESYGFTKNDRLLLSVPLYTQWGLNALLVCLFSHGASVVLQEYFDPEEALKLIHDERCTVFSGVPTHFIMMMENRDFDKYDVGSLRYANLTGEVVSRDLCRLVLESFKSAELINGYGMTESTGLITASGKEDSPESRFQTVGKALPGVELKIVDPDTGQDMPVGKEGEICTRGYHVMKGYYKRPEETARVIDREGWLHTGDLGMLLADGSLKFCGRMKDMIRSGGFNVFAQEIEEFIISHPKVKNVAVVGVSDEKKGEVVGAAVQLKENESCSEAEIIDFCKTKLSNYKVPRYVLFVEDFPLSATNKIQKLRVKKNMEERLSVAGTTKGVNKDV